MPQYCKYQKLQRYVSYDYGLTWTPMDIYTKGNLIESESADCGFVEQTRWDTKYQYCDGSALKGIQRLERLNANGNWQLVVPVQERTVILENNSAQCQ